MGRLARHRKLKSHDLTGELNAAPVLPPTETALKKSKRRKGKGGSSGKGGSGVPDTVDGVAFADLPRMTKRILLAAQAEKLKQKEIQAAKKAGVSRRDKKKQRNNNNGNTNNKNKGNTDPASDGPVFTVSKKTLKRKAYLADQKKKKKEKKRKGRASDEVEERQLAALRAAGGGGGDGGGVGKGGGGQGGSVRPPTLSTGASLSAPAAPTTTSTTGKANGHSSASIVSGPLGGSHGNGTGSTNNQQQRKQETVVEAELVDGVAVEAVEFGDIVEAPPQFTKKSTPKFRMFQTKQHTDRAELVLNPQDKSNRRKRKRGSDADTVVQPKSKRKRGGSGGKGGGKGGKGAKPVPTMAEQQIARQRELLRDRVRANYKAAKAKRERF